MRICLTSGTFHPDVGGPPTYLLALAKDLTQRGHPLRVVTYGEPGGAYPYPISRIPRRGPESLRLLRFATQTYRATRSADLLFVNDYGLPPALANLPLRKPVVMKIVGDFAWEYSTRHALLPTGTSIDLFQHNRYSTQVERLRYLQSWYARRADLVITPSHYLARLVSGWGVEESRLRVIYNAPTPSGSLADPSALRRREGYSPSDFVVVTVARLAPWKGIDVLIDAVAEVAQRVPAMKLLVVGDGEDREALERRAAPMGGRVRFTGQLEREQVLGLLRAANTLALVSSYEGLSHVLLEAMEAGLPIVASASGGNVELIEDGRNGLLVPHGDRAALAECLLRLAGSEGMTSVLAEAAREDARAHAWPRLVEETLAVFEEALASRNGRAA